MIKEKEKIHFRCKPILISSHKKWSYIGKYADTKNLIFNDPDIDIVRGNPYDIYLISPLYGEDLIISDFFTLVPDYNEIYRCEKFSGDNKVLGKKILISDIYYSTESPSESPHKELFEFNLKDVRKIVACSDHQSPLSLPIISKHNIKKIVDAINNDEEIFPDVSFNIYRMSDRQVISPEKNKITGSAIILEKTQEQIKVENEGMKLWNEKISQHIGTSSKCGNYKVLSAFLDEYTKNIEKIKSKNNIISSEGMPENCVEIGVGTFGKNNKKK